MGGARRLHALQPACRGRQLRWRHGACQHVPSGHRQDHDAGLDREAGRQPGGADSTPQPGGLWPHAGFHCHRRRLHPRACGLFRHLRVRHSQAGAGRRPADRGRGRQRGPGYGGARPRPHAARRGEAAPAAGPAPGARRLRPLHLAPRGPHRLLPKPARHAGHEHALQWRASRHQPHAQEALAPRARRQRGQTLQRPLLLPHRGC
mmetsp:Transcript_105252/g.297479  ORF Transcript_105252/g.297479 Transcript_105252/m.297479 type:complete len:205 (-) Transcript_105252:291-905(-)